MDPHPHYENHYGKLLHLNFIHQNSKDTKEKQQAHNEIASNKFVSKMLSGLGSVPGTEQNQVQPEQNQGF